MSASPNVPSCPPPIPTTSRSAGARSAPTRIQPLPPLRSSPVRVTGELDVTMLARPIDLVSTHHDVIWAHVLLDLELRWSLFESLTVLQELTHEVHTPRAHLDAFAEVVCDAHPGTRQALSRLALAWHAHFIEPYWLMVPPSLMYLRWRADIRAR